MKKYWTYLFGFALAFTLFSCERAFFEDEYDEGDPFESFDYLWEQVDRRYAFFKVKNINWDAKRSEYRSKIYHGISQDSLFNVLGGLMNELRDDHVNLRSTFNVSSYKVRLDGPDNYDRRIVEDNYIGRDYKVSGPFVHNWISNNEIGYVRFGAFTGTVDNVNLNYVLATYRNAKGLIIDLRENGGGAVTDMYDILARLIDQRTVVFKSRIRNGEDHDDFSALENAIVDPYEGPRFTNKPVMILVDRGTYSAGSFTALASISLPNVKLVGDTTGGGLGLPNGGYLPNGWFYRFSVTQAFTNYQALLLESGQEAKVNAENYENGVPPDIRVLLNRTDLDVDEVIERAIQEISN
ncbi:MAG: peptidase S41 [Flavobacteriales bacterium]|nr:peptidase S41 [Flavobacteriales bacterium]